MDVRERMFLNLESAVLDAGLEVKARADLLSDEFTEFGSSGRAYDKRSILEVLPSLDHFRSQFHDLRAAVLAKGLVLVTYRFTRTPPGGSPARSLRSSIWRLESGRWRMLFHQGTPEAGPS